MEDINPKFSLEQYIFYLNKLDANDKGDLFERSSLDYFREHHPGFVYMMYKNYGKVQKDYFGLPENDYGVDIIGLKEDGTKEIMFIQCKYAGDKNEKITFGNHKISHLICMAKIAKDFRPNWKVHQYVITTGKKVTDIDPTLRAIIGYDLCGKIRLNTNYYNLSLGPRKRVKKVLRDYQKKIISKLVDHFIVNDKKAGRIVMATGTGKTFTCLEYVRQNLLILREPKVLIVTNLRNLADQTFSVFEAELVSDVLLISQDGTTDPNTIKNAHQRIHISTYNSMEIPISVCKYDMVIFDESHHSGSDSRKNIIDKIKSKILYMTATEKEVTESELIAKYSIGDGIRDGVLVDYRINIFGCYIDPAHDIVEQRYKSMILGLITKINSEESTKIVVYCQDQKSAKLFEKLLSEEKKNIENPDVYIKLLISENSKYDRKKRLADQKKFTRAAVGIIINVNIMIEGIDIPEIDTIVFADNRQSKITILQSIGRALRISPRKRYSTICLGTEIMNDIDTNKNGMVLLEKQEKKIHNILKYLMSEDDTYLDFTDDYIKNYKIKYHSISVNKNKLPKINPRIKIDLPRRNGTKKEIYVQAPKIEEFGRNLEKINTETLVQMWDNAADKTKFLVELQKKDKKWNTYLKIWSWVNQNQTYPYYFFPKFDKNFRNREEYEEAKNKARKYVLRLNDIIKENTEFSRYYLKYLSNLVVHQTPDMWRKVLMHEDKTGLRITCRYQVFLLKLLRNSDWISGKFEKHSDDRPNLQNLIEILPEDLFYLGNYNVCVEKYVKYLDGFIETVFANIDPEILDRIKAIDYRTFYNHGLLQLLNILENQKALTEIWTVYHFVPKLPERVKKTFVDKVYSLGCWILSTQPWK